MDVEEQAETNSESNTAGAARVTSASVEQPVVLDEDTFASLPSEAESEEMHDAESQPELELPVLDISDGESETERFPIVQYIPAGIEDDVIQEQAAAPRQVGQMEQLRVQIEDDYDEMDDSDSSDIVFDDEQPARNGHWYIPAGHVHAAISELVAQGRRGEGGPNRVAGLLSRDTFMQRMRHLVFSLDHRRRNRGNSDGEGGSQGVTNDGEGDYFGESDQEHNDEPEPRAEEVDPENSIRFDTNLAAEHSYLGANMSRVSGVNYLEEGQQYKIMLFSHQHVLFPGEILPFMISEAVIESDIDDQNGLLFGVCFPFLSHPGSEGPIIYGVTCQIYEKGTDQRGNTLIKSRALQRFTINTSTVTSRPPFITVQPQVKCYGMVKILPELHLPEPLQCIDMGSMYRFRGDSSMSQMYRRFQAASTPWPAHVYDNYSTMPIVEKARALLAQHKIDTMPTDPVQLSFWLVRNLHLSESMTRTIFTIDSVNLRMKMIASTFKQDAIFTCRFCGNRIANCGELFAMSKHGVQTQYCNSAGHIHEINTVYQLLREAILHSGNPSTEFSWFPGYQWHIIVCKICSRHIGWEFKALEPNLVPKTFFGISRSTVRISGHVSDPRAVIYRNFMRLARLDVQ